MKTLKIINFFLKLALLTTVTMALSLGVEAASGYSIEVEPNNSYTTAKLTYDDYDSIGSIGYSGDSDWWKITFDEEGMANFWLGNIPSGCNYQLYVYPGSIFSDSVAYSANTGNSQELVRCHVEPGITYYVRIHSASGFSNTEYLLRIKNYDITKPANFFTTYYKYNNDDHLFDEDSIADYAIYTTRPLANALVNVRNMGFVGNEYYNNSTAAIYRTLPQSSIFVIGCHGDAGYIKQGRKYTPDSILYANSYSGMQSVDRAVSNYSSGELSGTYLFLTTSCYGGSTSSVYGNVVDQVINKGAMVAIGWTGSVNTNDSNEWTKKFFEYVESGLNVYNAINATNQYFRDNDDFDNFDEVTLNDMYYGNSAVTSLVLSTGQ